MSAVMIQADARRLPLDDASVQCLITSIPYWGLRDYGIPPGIWGGDEGCDHAWAEESIERENRTGLGLQHSPACTRGGAKKIARVGWQKFSRGQCVKCGAVRCCYGLEPTIDLYIVHTVQIFREVRRVLRKDGTVFLNIGDSYNAGTSAARLPSNNHGGNGYGKHGYWVNPNITMRVHVPAIKPKDQCLIPHRVAIALQDDGWWVRDTIVWAKSNCMPSSVTDRTTLAHEYVFLLTRSARYFFDADAIREPAGRFKQSGRSALRGQVEIRPRGNLQSITEQSYHPLGRNARSVWDIPTSGFRKAHFATFPPKLVSRCVRAGTSERGCCGDCGSPWARVTKVTYTNPGNRSTNGPRSIERKLVEGGTAGFDVRLERRAVTAGWRPTCRCYDGRYPEIPRYARLAARGHPNTARRLRLWRLRNPAPESWRTVPCIVLDNFAGSGTVPMVAEQFGRRGIGFDLKADYVAMGRQRIAEDRVRRALEALRGPRKLRHLKPQPGEMMLFGVPA